MRNLPIRSISAIFEIPVARSESLQQRVSVGGDRNDELLAVQIDS
jgi:hypothetical protein